MPLAFFFFACIIFEKSMETIEKSYAQVFMVPNNREVLRKQISISIAYEVFMETNLHFHCVLPQTNMHSKIEKPMSKSRLV